MMKSGGTMKPGAAAGKIARAQATEPKTQNRGTSFSRASGPEMKSGGLKSGIGHLKADHAMRGANSAGKMPK